MRRFALIVLALAVGIGVAISQAGRYLVASDPLPAHADAIVMLAGSLADRSMETADLYAQGIAARVIVTRERPARAEWALKQRGVTIPDADMLRRATLEQLGVPGSAIVRLRRRTYSTESEAATIARYACSHRLRSLVVVTSASHTYRAGRILRDSLEPQVKIYMRASRYDPFPVERWWRVRHAAKLVLSEFQKLANYLLVQRWRIEPCGGLRRLRPAPPRS